MLNTDKLKPISTTSLQPLLGIKCLTAEGVTVFAGLSGCGKSVYLAGVFKQLQDNGYNPYYLNYDESPMEIDSYEPVTLEDLKDLVKEADDKDVVFIDTLKAFCSYSDIDIDDDKEAYKMMEAFTRMSRDTGVTIILVHHVDDKENLEGSTSIYEGADAVTIFERNKDTGIMYGNIKKQRFSFDCEASVNLELYE